MQTWSCTGSIGLCLIILVSLIAQLESWTFSNLFSHRRPGRIISFHHDESQDNIDLHFMNLALSEAKRAADRYDEVPIGAVVVRRDQDGFRLLATASNRVETMHDASAHAELLALRQAAKRSKNWRLVNATLYTTLEPCPLCLSASLNFRVSRIVYGAPDHRLGAIETIPNNLIETHPFHGITDIGAGLMQNQSTALLQDFFRRKRAEKKRTSDRRLP